jgi:hypothetical protein
MTGSALAELPACAADFVHRLVISPPQHRRPHAPLIADNNISVTSICLLVQYILNKPDLYFSCEQKPSTCVVDEAWQQTGLAVPPKEAVATGWKAVLKYIREVSSACLGVQWNE